jgi:hypothetical protein
MNLKIYKLNEINFSRIKYLKPTISKNTTSIFTLYDDEILGPQPLIFEVPYLHAPDNIIPIQSEYISHTLMLPLMSTNNKLTQMIVDFFKKFERKIISDTRKNKDKWGIIKNKLQYEQIVKQVDSKEKIFENGAIVIKIINNDQFKTTLYTKNNNIYKKVKNPQNYRHAFNGVAGNCYVKVIMECVSFWYRGDTFGIYLKPHKVRVNHKNPLINITLSESDDNSLTIYYLKK